LDFFRGFNGPVSPPPAFLRAWAKALPAADFDAAEVRPSLSTLEAAVAARADVVSFLAFDWVKALPAAAFDAFPVEEELSALAAAFAALGPVCLLAIATP
jgi:hypothetical protein